MGVDDTQWFGQGRVIMLGTTGSPLPSSDTLLSMCDMMHRLDRGGAKRGHERRDLRCKRR